MNDVGEIPGSVIRCSADGVVSGYEVDAFRLAERVHAGAPLTNLAIAEDRPKLAGFLARIRERDAAFDWPVNVDLDGRIETLHFGGLKLADGLLITAAANRDRLTGLNEDLLRINNEQTNAVRTLSQALEQGRREDAGRDHAMYEDMSRVNNELTTLQRTVAKQNAELEKLNQLKNQWLGIAAHDLRGPLGVILTYSRFLQSEAADVLAEEHRQFVDTIHASSRFLLDLVEQLLDVSAIESGELELDLELAELGQLLRHNLQLNRVLAARREMTVALDLRARALFVEIDVKKITQVLNNLIGNAIKYAPAGSRIFVTAEQREDRAWVAVRDEGPGIPAGEQDRLFRPFGRTSVTSSSGEKSTGLGLSIVRRVIEGHGGQVGVDSSPGAGATFWFELPIYDVD